MGRFVPCTDPTACTEAGTHCRACGRSRVEIDQTRLLIEVLVDLVLEMDYDNPAEFAGYVARRVMKKVAHRRSGSTRSEG